MTTENKAKTYENAPASRIKTERYGIAKAFPPKTSLVWYKALLLCASKDGEIVQKERDWVIGHAITFHPQLSESQIDELRTYDAPVRLMR